MKIEEMLEETKKLIEIKGFPNDKWSISQKLLWAWNEYGEALQEFVEGGDSAKIIEELIDVIFYVLNVVIVLEKFEVHLLYLQNYDLDKDIYKPIAKDQKAVLKIGIKLHQLTDMYKKGLHIKLFPKYEDCLYELLKHICSMIKVVNPNISPVQMFREKLEKNLERDFQYGQSVILAEKET